MVSVKVFSECEYVKVSECKSQSGLTHRIIKMDRKIFDQLRVAILLGFQFFLANLLIKKK